MRWIFLTGAILAEVSAALALRAATTGCKRWYAVVLSGYALAFILLTLALGQGLGIGVAYGIWAAAGVALTAVASHVLFEEPFTWLMAAGIALIMGGVLMVEVGGAAH
ncbi:Multidrug resistance protein EbrA [Micromonospora sp. MW-13]|uniref:DMT family transporter n=1 Tax=Micromonospora sp. MW-13 TaxID=2094022 RepID=UPI000E452593|nr:SMR family transporter [Micromonospora sp. MW-13]RGC66600.1 Multidrug resistance protein EbrA [Micromonospora sp. MW-13]